MDVKISSSTDIPYQTEFINQLSTNPTVMIIITVMIITYYVLFSSLGIEDAITPKEPNVAAKGGFLFVEIIIWSIFVLLIVINGMMYMFNIDITTSIQNLFSATPELDIVIDSDVTSPILQPSKQVFHISNNKYSYADAKAICSAYDGRLANWKDIESAYSKGADWCSMGWSDGQMALYPTQFDKWTKLQEIQGHKQDCGRPGVNGGYIANPNVRFGVNCFGFKPKMSPADSNAMKMSPLYPTTRRELIFDKQVDYWRDKLPNLSVSPFNHNNWSVL